MSFPMPSTPPPSLLTIPCELRNAIYLYIFTPDSTYDLSPLRGPLDPIAKALKPQYDRDTSALSPCTAQCLSVLQTCKQIHDEAHLLAQSLTRFHVVGDASHPAHFEAQIAAVRRAKVSAIRNITLTARISKIRALNEAWCGLPFGNPALDLDTLTIIPKRPDANYSAYAEIAYHSQAHILAHTFAETFKRLRNVRVVVVRNYGCFNEFFWELMYKGLILRMWNWGGHSCGIRFLECSNKDGESGGQYFKAWMKDGLEGRDVGQEMKRFLNDGVELPEPTLAALAH